MYEHVLLSLHILTNIIIIPSPQVLMNMFFQDDDEAFTLDEEPRMDRRGSLTYEEIVKDLILEETQYIRDLKMIIKVFREPFAKLFPGSKVCNLMVM